MDAVEYGAVKKDEFDHAFTSEQSIRSYARFLRAGGSGITRDDVDEATMWLQQHRDELPGELYDRDGLPRFQKAEFATDQAPVEVIIDTEDGVLQSEVGMYYTAEQDCNRSIGSYFREVVADFEGAEREAVRALGPHVPAVRNLIRLKRGASYQRHAEAQAKRLRWQGMEEYDAVAKADDHLRAGAKLEAAKSNAQALPSLERLCALLSYDSETGVFTRLVKAGRARAGDVVSPDKQGQMRIDGQLYLASRVAVLIHTGDDPANKTVSVLNGDKRDVRWSNLEVQVHAMKATNTSIRRKRVDGEDKFDSVVKLNGKAVTIGTYRTAVQAAAARGIFKRSLEMGLRDKSTSVV